MSGLVLQCSFRLSPVIRKEFRNEAEESHPGITPFRALKDNRWLCRGSVVQASIDDCKLHDA
jgi:hypothetical protein